MKHDFILGIDQGTTSSRAILFNRDFSVHASAQQEFTQYFPHPGWVEHDAEEIINSVVATVRTVLARAQITPADIAGVGITNQRETTVVWDKDTGKAVYNAIVWQDRRTADMCAEWRASGSEAMISEKTGLLLDPYFSASKVAWILRQDESLAQKAAAGKLLFGTIDTFLLWRLAGGVHKTDATNAARTMLYNLHLGTWDDELLDFFSVPAAMLPEICDCASDFAMMDSAIFGGTMPVRGVAGDQQAAAIGQACFSAGMLKATYGTGCFALLNTAEVPIHSKNRLLTTVAYQLDGKRTFALEGSIFVAGAAVQWLRDGIKLINDSAQSGALAETAEISQQLVMVPAFTGLGAPYWQPNARGAIFGLTRATTAAELCLAALEAVCLQTHDLLTAMQNDTASEETPILRVDGGMAASDWTMQRLADLLDTTVERPSNLETTAWGAAYLAGLHAGVYPAPAEMSSHWRLEKRFVPSMSAAPREHKMALWKNAVHSVLAYTENAPGAVF